MKFHNNEATDAYSFPINFGLLMLRFCTVCLLIYYELAIHLGKAWKNVWNEEAWGLVDQFENHNLPLPGAVSVAIILGSFLVALGILLGFLVRVNSSILILIFGFLLFLKVKTSDYFTSEAIVLYIIILVTLLITGPGRYSMDHILMAQRNRRKA